MSLSLNYPTISPSLLLDFVNSNRVDPLVTFTRSSAATYFDETGTLQTAGNNVPRIDFDPSTLVCRGLLVEEQRTNSIRNNTMQGAVAGTPGTLPSISGSPVWTVGGLGTLTQEIVGTSTSNGITYIDIRFSGTTSTTQTSIINEPANQVAASVGQTWTNSAYVSVVGGSLSNITSVRLRITERDSGSNYLAESSTIFTPTSTLTRYAHTGTLSNASVAYVQPSVFFTFSVGVAIDITLRIGLPQLELGAFATSVIPTTSTAVTRAADVASVNTLSPWFNSSEYTVYAEFQRDTAANAASGGAGTVPRIWAIAEAGVSTQVQIRLASAATIEAATFGFSPAGYVFTNWAVGTVVKTAVRYQVDNFAVDTNVGALNVDTSVAAVSGSNELALGQQRISTASGYLSGWLRRLTYYPRALSDAQLQALTA